MSSPQRDDPTPLVKGRFSVYETPDGGFVLAYRLDGADEDSHYRIPAFIVKAARKQFRRGFTVDHLPTQLTTGE
jgi:hypothetical protein